jgi:glycosyltransferase involved in cell wall biosynthesis
MKLLVLSESPNHVSCRYRVQAFEPALRRAGWDLAIRPLSGAGTSFFEILREADRSDVVLIQRRLLAPAKLQLLRRFARRLVYDVDDALFLRDSNSTRPADSWRRRGRFRAMVAASDAVIAGNEYLAECAARWSRYTRIVCIPTCVEPAAYTPMTGVRRGPGLRVAWIGSRSTLSSLTEIAPALRHAQVRVPGLELHVISDRAPDFPGVNILLRQWSPEVESHELAQCDVGISWLPDHPWSRGKCGLKVLQYMAAGLPVVINSMGVHRRIVTTGVQGWLVEQPDDVARAIVELAGDPNLRVKMGERGRRRVESEYSVARWTELFVDVIRGHDLSQRAAQ